MEVKNISDLFLANGNFEFHSTSDIYNTVELKKLGWNLTSCFRVLILKISYKVRPVRNVFNCS